MCWLLWGRYFKGWGDSPIGWRESVAFFPFERISPQLSTTSHVIQEGWCKTGWWRWLDRWPEKSSDSLWILHVCSIPGASMSQWAQESGCGLSEKASEPAEARHWSKWTHPRALPSLPCSHISHLPAHSNPLPTPPNPLRCHLARKTRGGTEL